MSTDSNEKSQSTFPRSSLRARNRTIVMAPADIEDFRPEPRKTKTPIKLEDIFDEGLLGSNDAPASMKDESSAGQSQSVRHKSGASSQVEEVSDAPVQDSPEPFAALGEDTFEAIADPFDATPTGGLDKVDPSESEELHATALLDVENTMQSVAPVARIVRTAEVEPPRSMPPVVKPSASTYETPVVSAGAFEYESKVDLEETMEDLHDQGQDRITDGDREHLEVRKLSKLIGFLVSYELDRYGRYVELREGRLLVSCDGRASDNCLVITDPSVSPMHAIMRISSNGTIMILDQLSEHGTRIKRCGSGKEEALLGDKGALEHGDVVIFGECAYHVCVLKGI